ncbi:hypothetical protein KVK49_04415 [Helicobacter pylori]|nr:hypothetical protein KVK49_04415 [Helicobacter pylori]
MLYPFLKIPDHYSASDRARKVRNKNLKSALKNQQKISKKKKIKPNYKIALFKNYR